MPEGVEVKRWAEGLHEQLVGKVITHAAVVGGRYMRASPEALGLSRLKNAVIERISCKGKLLVFHMRADAETFAILSTLGMTGWWKPNYFFDETIDKYKRIALTFADHTMAVFFDPRNFGTFKVVSYSEMKRKLAELGPDILSPPQFWETITIPEFLARVKRFGKKQTLAEALLDQRIAAGCGNYIRADAMYQASFSPHRPISDLSEAELLTIWRAMHKVAVTSYEAEGAYQTVCYSQSLSPLGSPIEAYTDGNSRTVWWCPKEQV